MHQNDNLNIQILDFKSLYHLINLNCINCKIRIIFKHQANFYITKIVFKIDLFVIKMEFPCF